MTVFSQNGHIMICHTMDHFVLFTKEPHYVDYIILGHIAQNIYEPPLTSLMLWLCNSDRIHCHKTLNHDIVSFFSVTQSVRSNF